MEEQLPNSKSADRPPTNGRERLLAVGLFLLLATVSCFGYRWWADIQADRAADNSTENNTATDDRGHQTGALTGGEANDSESNDDRSILADDGVSHYAMLPNLQLGSRLTRPYPAPHYAREVRVHLTTRSSKPVQLKFIGPVRVTAIDSTSPLLPEQPAESIDVSLSDAGIQFGSHDLTVSALELTPVTPPKTGASQTIPQPTIWVNDHLYHGRIRLHRRNNRLTVVNVVEINRYLASVVDSEMPIAFGSAARQAQAIVARTYALYQCQQSAAHPQFDLFADTRSQKYLGYQYYDSRRRHLAGESEQSRKIIRETRGVVCTYNNQLFSTYFSAVCGGETTNGQHVFTDAAPPLQSVACNWCREASRYRWSTRFEGDELSQQLSRHFQSIGRPLSFPVSLSLPGDSARENMMQAPLWVIEDARQTKRTITRPALRRVFPGQLPSPHFEVTAQGDDWIVNGRGHGHGVGLCQWGARGMGQEGRRAVDIVRHYYPGCAIVVLHGR